MTDSKRKAEVVAESDEDRLEQMRQDRDLLVGELRELEQDESSEGPAYAEALKDLVRLEAMLAKLED